MKIVIVITAVLGGLTGWAVIGMIAAPIIDPRVEITSLEFSPGECVPDYFLFFRTGEHRTVMATFGLSNHGYAAGEATVHFTVDGAKVDEGKFFIGAGQEETKMWQFRVGDCRDHVYGAYLGDVRRK